MPPAHRRGEFLNLQLCSLLVVPLIPPQRKILKIIAVIASAGLLHAGACAGSVNLEIVGFWFASLLPDIDSDT